MNRFRRAEVVKAAERDFNLLAALCLPSDLDKPFPPEYLAAAHMLQDALASRENKDFNFAVGYPRGFSKTTWAKLITLWGLCFTDRKYYLVACSAKEKASAFIGDVSRLLNSPNIRALFGSYEEDAEKNTQALKIFKFRGETRIIQAIGAKGDPRGSNIDFKRPDVLICDDVQSRENAKSKVEASALYEWYSSTFYLAKASTGITHLYLGNTFPYEGWILSKLRDDPNYTTFVVGAILANGESLWPELHPVEKVKKDIALLVSRGKAETALSELMNDPRSVVATGFDYESIPEWDKQYFDLPMSGCIMIDVATDKDGADDTAIGAALYFDSLDKPYFAAVIAEKLSPKETIKQAMKLAMRFDIQAIFVEDVAYQSSLVFWANEICNKYAIEGFHFYPFSPRRLSKNARIMDSLRALQAGEIILHPDVAPLVLNQIARFDPTTTNNKDDILDLLDYFKEIPVKEPEKISLLLRDSLSASTDASSYNYPEEVNCSI